MKLLNRLGVFFLIAFLLVGEAILITGYFMHVRVKVGLADMQEIQKARLALVIVSFHSYYHVWPANQGSIDNQALVELGGFPGALINTQHIDFFKNNNVNMVIQDENGRPLMFSTDDSIGTCTVFSVANENKDNR
jgi:hypothetical protein